MRWSRRTSRPAPPLCEARNIFHDSARARGYSLDAAQRRAIDQLCARSDRGVYLWGPVGRGKSWLMATYFAALPTDRKIRVHFHEFFRDLHAAIRRNRYDLGAALDQLLDGIDVVCFDEFHVHDPADGIFVGRLLSALLERDVLLVLTSNYPPNGLLPNPLFHQDFVPTIELIEQSLTVIAVDGPIDYRTTSDHNDGFAAGAWVSPGTDAQLDRLDLVRPRASEHRELSPAGHIVHALRADPGCLWFDFADLCASTTAPVDYLALASEYPRWVISGIPDLRAAGREPAQRFANLIDVLYDHDICVEFLADVLLESLTADGAKLPVEIARLMSRLGQLTHVQDDGNPLADTTVGNLS